MTTPTNFRILGAVLLSLGMLSACFENGSQVDDDAADATGDRNPMEEVLPPDVEILGSCTEGLVSGFCDLYYRPAGTKLFDETKAHAACRDIGDDIVWNEDWWSTDNACPASVEYNCRTYCPTSVLESACRLFERVEFQYNSASRPVDERRTACERDGGTFFEF